MMRLTKERLLANLLFRRKSKRAQTEAKLRSLQMAGAEFSSELSRVQKCTAQYPCNTKWCPDCAVPKPKESRAIVNDRDDHPEWYEGVPLNPRSGSPRSRSGKSFLQFYQAFSERNVVTGTIHLAMTPFDPIENESLGEDVFSQSEIAVKNLKKVLLRFNPDISVKGKIETIPMEIDEHSRKLLADKSWLDSVGDRTLVMNEHVHFLLTLDDFSMDELREFLKKNGYSGTQQVCIKPIVWTGKNSGSFSYGPKGYGEYAGKRTYSGSFPKKDIEVAQAVARMDKVFSASKKNFRINATNLDDPVSRKECLPPRDLNETYQEYLEQEHNRSDQFTSIWEHELWMTYGQCELHPDDRTADLEYPIVKSGGYVAFSFSTLLSSITNNTILVTRVLRRLYYNWASVIFSIFNGLKGKFGYFRRGMAKNLVTHTYGNSFHKRE